MSIVNTTVQLIVCSQIFKKIRNLLMEQLYFEETLLETELTSEALRFMLFVIRKSHARITPIYSLSSQQIIAGELKEMNGSEKCSRLVGSSLVKLAESVIPFLLSYFTLLQ